MARRKKASEEIRDTDGRKNNAKLPSLMNDKLALGNSTKAERRRVQRQAKNALKEEYGSEEEFFKYLAQMSKTSYSYMKLFLEYAYGKPTDMAKGDSTPKDPKAPVINFTQNNLVPNEKRQKTIDIPSDED